MFDELIYGCDETNRFGGIIYLTPQAAKPRDGGPSEQSEGAGAPEIEVTAEMAEAGRSAYYLKRHYRGDPPVDEETVALIYRAMCRLAPRA